MQVLSWEKQALTFLALGGGDIIGILSFLTYSAVGILEIKWFYNLDIVFEEFEEQFCMGYFFIWPVINMFLCIKFTGLISSIDSIKVVTDERSRIDKLELWFKKFWAPNSALFKLFL